MGHVPNGRDVERALERYKAATGDHTAQVIRSGPNGSFYRLDGAGRFHGENYGAATAAAVINAFTDGWLEHADDEDEINLG